MSSSAKYCFVPSLNQSFGTSTSSLCLGACLPTARRAATCVEIRVRLEKMAKEADTAFAATLENAASCLLLDTICIDDTQETRPWLLAFTAHVRALAEDEQLPDEAGFPGQGYVWLLFLCTDAFSEINSGGLTATYMDQLLLSGDEAFDLAITGQAVSGPSRAALEQARMAQLPFIYLSLARELTEKLTGTYSRRHPLDEVVLSAFLCKLEHMRSISSSVCTVLETLLASHPPQTTLFREPHSDPTTSPLEAMLAPIQGFYLLTTWSFTTLVLPLFREIKRRRLVLEDNTLRDLAGGNSLSFTEKLARDRLVLAEQQLREYFVVALEANDKLVQNLPATAVSATLRKEGAVEWIVVLLDEVEGETLAIDEKLCEILERTVSTLKLGGYIHFSPYIDGLIHRLEHCTAAHRNPLPHSLPPGPALPLAPPSSDPVHLGIPILPLELDSAFLPATSVTAAPAFDPSQTLLESFVNLDAIASSVSMTDFSFASSTPFPSIPPSDVPAPLVSSTCLSTPFLDGLPREAGCALPSASVEMQETSCETWTEREDGIAVLGGVEGGARQGDHQIW
ncbi:hypothetical protein JCM8547_003193 [Rhodosporidiobolus lusitaniae]